MQSPPSPVAAWSGGSGISGIGRAVSVRFAGSLPAVRGKGSFPKREPGSGTMFVSPHQST